MAEQILIFELQDQRYGVPLADVREILRAVSVTPLPEAPAVIDGVINVRGAVSPVLDVRRRLGLETKPLDPSDHFILTNAGDRGVVLRVDGATSIAEVEPSDIEEAKRVVPSGEYVAGIAKLPDGLVLIHDLNAFLSEAEVIVLDKAVSVSGQSRAEC